MIKQLASLTVAGVLVSAPGFGQDCVEAPFTETYEHGGSVERSAFGSGCGFTSMLNGDSTAAATVHTVRRDVPDPLRMYFRVDLSELDSLTALQSVSLASAVSQAAVGTGSDANADLFRVNVLGNLAGTGRRLVVAAACAVCADNTAIAIVDLTSDQTEIGVEVDIGAGSDGELRVWVDTPFSEPATSTLSALDNAAWFGAYRLSLGLSSPSAAFASLQAGNPVEFDRIGIGDSQLVWRDFEADGEICAGLPIPAQTQVVGDTCGAEVLLPTLAAGSTITRAPSDVYAFSPPSPGWPGVLSLDTEANLAAFVCWEFCGPAVRCLGAATPGNPLALTEALPGEQRVVVTSRVPGECGNYTLTFSGPLE